MLYTSKNIVLKNDINAVFRNPLSSDAKAMTEYLKTCAAETNFILYYPEECIDNEEDERIFLERINASLHTMMIVCTINEEIAGNCALMFNENLKTKHRARVAIGLLKKYWGIGIGTAMFSEMIATAKKKGVLQLELDYIEGNERARGLYEKMGFVPVAEKPNAIRLKDGTMLKEISMIKQL